MENSQKETLKKAVFYSPYIPHHFGGGEKHLFDVAMQATKCFDVSIAIPNLSQHSVEDVIDNYQSFLGYSIKPLRFIDTPLGTEASFFQKLWWTKQFEYLYYVTDGSIFLSLAKHNNLHIQIPFSDSKNLFNKWKLSKWDIKNCNSYFTKFEIERFWKVPVTHVVHPVVDTEELGIKRKKMKKIISVGRFFRSLHSKRQDIIVEIFSYLHKNHPHQFGEYELVMIGHVEDQDYFDLVKQLAEGLPVTFKSNVSREELVSELKESEYYLHAAGFEVDEVQHPEQVEHFGISTIEAMAAGCIPLAVGKGGQKEILGEELEWCQWQTPQECAQKLVELSEQEKRKEELRKLARERAHRYGVASFEKSVAEMFNISP